MQEQGPPLTPEHQSSILADLAQASKKFGAWICHNEIYHPEYSYIDSGVYLGGLLVENQFWGHGDLGTKLLNTCEQNNHKLTAVFAIMKPRERAGGIIPARPVPDTFWNENGASTLLFNVTDEDADISFEDISKILLLMSQYLDPTSEQNKDKQILNKTPAIYVHCNLGVGRSFTLVALYLLQKYPEKNLYDIFDLIAQKRPQVRPNPKQVKFMLNFVQEKILDGKYQQLQLPNDCDQRKYKYLTPGYGESGCMFAWKASLIAQNLFVSLPLEATGFSKTHHEQPALENTKRNQTPN